MSLGRPMSNSLGRARYSLVVITLCGVSALGKSLGWSTRMTQPVMSRASLFLAAGASVANQHDTRGEEMGNTIAFGKHALSTVIISGRHLVHRIATPLSQF